MAMAISSRATPRPSEADAARGGSLKGRLLALLLALTAGLWCISAAVIYFEAQKEGRKLFDESLREAGGLLLDLAEHELLEHGPTLGAELMRAEGRPAHYDLQFQIWTAGAASAYRTGAAPEKPFMPLDATGFGWTEVNGERWRTYATWNSTRALQIQIAEPLARRRALSSFTFLHLSGFALALLPVSLALTWWILTRSLAPLRRSAAAVEMRSADDFAPVATTGTPSEVLPLFLALNRLLKRVRDALQLERRFTADAAHELRSPLAAIRATAQVMQGARTAHELEEAGTDLLASVDRSSRLIDQLLLLARIDAGAHAALRFAPVALAPLVKEQCDALQAAASQKGVALETRLDDSMVNGVTGLLSVLVRNLLDNAIRYSPPGATAQVACATLDGCVQLCVTDDGPGIPPPERQQVFERFYRVLGNGETGSGLGLSIVKRIAELHRASVEVRSGLEGRGTAVLVVFERAG